SATAGYPEKVEFYGCEDRQHRAEGRYLRSGCPHRGQRFSLSLSQRTYPGAVLGEIPPLLPDVGAGTDKPMVVRDGRRFGANFFLYVFVALLLRRLILSP